MADWGTFWQRFSAYFSEFARLSLKLFGGASSIIGRALLMVVLPSAVLSATTLAIYAARDRIRNNHSLNLLRRSAYYVLSHIINILLFLVYMGFLYGAFGIEDNGIIYGGLYIVLLNCVLWKLFSEEG